MPSEDLTQLKKCLRDCMMTTHVKQWRACTDCLMIISEIGVYNQNICRKKPTIAEGSSTRVSPRNMVLHSACLLRLPISRHCQVLFHSGVPHLCYELPLDQSCFQHLYFGDRQSVSALTPLPSQLLLHQV